MHIFMHIMHPVLAFCEACEELVKGALQARESRVWAGLRGLGSGGVKSNRHLPGEPAFGRTFPETQWLRVETGNHGNEGNTDDIFCIEVNSNIDFWNVGIKEEEGILGWTKAFWFWKLGEMLQCTKKANSSQEIFFHEKDCGLLWIFEGQDQ